MITHPATTSNTIAYKLRGMDPLAMIATSKEHTIMTYDIATQLPIRSLLSCFKGLKITRTQLAPGSASITVNL